MFYPIGSCLRLTPVGDAEADGLLFYDLPIIVGPVPVIVLENQLVRISVGEILLRPACDFGSNQPIEHPEWVIGNLRHGNVRERSTDGGRINIASPWEATAVPQVAPIPEHQMDLRRSDPGLKLLLRDVRPEGFEEL